MIRRANARVLVLVGLVALSVVALGMLVLRKVVAPDADHYRFLIWNLILAWVPMLCALGAYDLHRRRFGRPVVALLAAVWLVFLPNAPYLMTDFIHLDKQPGVSLWYDTLLFGAFGLSGLLLGVVSLSLMHSLVRRVLSAAVAWSGVVVVLVLTSFGILLGRIQRWNSWDVLTNPGQLWADVAGRSLNPLDHPRLLGWMIAFVAVIGTTYVVVHRLMESGRSAGEQTTA